jgi:hypothetical protein
VLSTINNLTNVSSAGAPTDVRFFHGEFGMGWGLESYARTTQFGHERAYKDGTNMSG